MVRWMYDRITYEYHGPKCSDLLLLVHIAIAEPETGIGTPFLRSAVVVRGFVAFPEDDGQYYHHFLLLVRFAVAGRAKWVT